jgi:hypothetical protein
VVRVTLCHERKFVAHQHLYLVQLDTCLSKSCRKGVAQIADYDNYSAINFLKLV